MAAKAKTEPVSVRYVRLRNNLANTEGRLRGFYDLMGAGGADISVLIQVYTAMVNSRNQLNDATIGIPAVQADIDKFNEFAKSYEGDANYNAVTEMTTFRDALNTAIASTEAEFGILTTTYPSDHAKVTALRSILQTANSNVE